MIERRLVPYDPNRLSPERADLQIDGQDSPFGSINSKDGFVDFRRMTVERDGVSLFDKLIIDPSSGAFVMPVRINPEGQAEFLLVNEWKDTLGGYTPNIIQGRTKEGEEPADAARRLVRSEAGYDVASLALLGRQIFDSAYIAKDQPYFLAHIPYDQQRSELNLKKYEDIGELPWMSLEQIRRHGIRDGKTTIGIYLAEQAVNPKLH